jgi:hypothetical protein
VWLGLPPGPWPPDHYALLGLAPGAGDPAAVEGRVLERMERLRPHQLLHPEAVTEGMNRLAQALVCLTDPAARAAYDRGLGLTPAFELVEDEPLLAEVIDDAAPADPAPPYEVVDDGPRPNDTLPLVGLPDDFAQRPPTPPHPPRAAARKPVKLKRRALYRRLAALRKAVRAWEGLRPVLATPGEPLATPVAVLRLLRALADARAALPAVAFATDGAAAGAVVRALVRLPTAPSAVRGLLPTQRMAVARDWHDGYALLRAERDFHRRLAARPRAGRRAGWQLRSAVRRTPELVLIALAALVLIGAALRRTQSNLFP